MINIIPSVEEMKRTAAQLKEERKTIGLVPTMGYFHDGHVSLMRRSAAENDVTITTLFVNPTQFGANEDLAAYPRNLERDTSMAAAAGVDFLFTPTNEMMYPPGYKTYIRVEEWSDLLCGVTRPVHFRGVTTVCCKLFNICRPDRAYFGSKDAQQFLIIRKMVADLNMNLEVVPMPIVRETDGLAMSSRNVYLTPEERADAALLNKSLAAAKELYEKGETRATEIRAAVTSVLQDSPRIRIDYIEIVNTETLEPAGAAGPGTLIALAVFLGKARLIDNVII